jgi:hypothetical protein
LVSLFDLVKMPGHWRDFLALSAPAELLVEIEPLLEGAQTVTMGGRLGVGDLNLRAELHGGLGELTTAPLSLMGGLESSDIAGLTRQIGFGDAALFAGEGSMLVSIGLEGTPANSVETGLTVSLGDESLSYAGNLLVAGQGEIQGTGRLDVALADAGGLARIVGARGLSLPQATATAQLHFEGSRLARLTEITGASGETGFAGTLSLSRTGTTAAVAGDMAIDTISAEGLAATLLGRAALVDGAGVWPEGPVVLGEQSRSTRGTVAVTAGSVSAGGVERLGRSSFELSWDESRLRLARFEATAGAGQLALDVSVCCAGPLADKTISGRVSLAAMPIDVIAPGPVSAMLDGVLDGGMRFEGTGASIGEVLAAASGEGNFTLSDFSAERFSPRVFPTVASLSDVLNMEPDAMEAIMGLALEQGRFSAPAATGAFTIAGGVLRLANLLVEGDGAGLAGSLNLGLDTLELGGSFVMTPRGFDADGGLVGPDISRIVARLGGSLLAPEVTLDLEEMIASVMVRANEIEVDRLEALRAEDAERQRAAAEERNRLIEAQRQRAAEEAARREAEEAARRAAEEEARRLEEQQLPAQDPTPMLPPLDLGLPPPANPPAGIGINQPQF